MKRDRENEAKPSLSSAPGIVSGKKQKSSPKLPLATESSSNTLLRAQSSRGISSVPPNGEPMGSSSLETRIPDTNIPEALQNVGAALTSMANRNESSEDGPDASSVVPFRVHVTHSEGPEGFLLSAEELDRNLSTLSDQLHSPSSSLRTVESNLRSWTLMSPVLMKTPSKSSSLSPVSMTPSKGSGTQNPAKTPSSSSGSQSDTIRPADPVRRKPYQAFENINSSTQVLQRSSPNSDRRSRQWLSRCFLACILSAEGKVNPSKTFLDDAKVQYWQMARSNDRQLLTAQIVLISVLHSHGQLDMAGTLIDQAYYILEQYYDNQSPMIIVANYFRVGARQRLKQSSIQTSSLAQAHKKLSSSFGPTSSHALAALYSLAFLQIVRKEYESAESSSRQLYDLARQTFDPYHLITIASLTARARALKYLKRPREAIPLLVDATERDTIALGYSHPLRLDHRRRLANTYRDLGDSDNVQLVESIYREVFEARKQMLGIDHPYTRGILQQLLEFLRERDRAVEAQEMEEMFTTGRGGQGFHVRVIGSY